MGLYSWYTTGFEAPTYSLAALDGQDSWTLTDATNDTFLVQNGTVISGAQTLEFNAHTANWVSYRREFTAPVTAIDYDIEFKLQLGVNQGNNAAGKHLWIWAGPENNTDMLWQLQFCSDKVYYWDKDQTGGNRRDLGVAPGTGLHTYRIRTYPIRTARGNIITAINSVTDVYYDGAIIYSGTVDAATQSVYGTIDRIIIGADFKAVNNTGLGYFDDLVVQRNTFNAAVIAAGR